MKEVIVNGESIGYAHVNEEGKITGPEAVRVKELISDTIKRQGYRVQDVVKISNEEKCIYVFVDSTS